MLECPSLGDYDTNLTAVLAKDCHASGTSAVGPSVSDTNVSTTLHVSGRQASCTLIWIETVFLVTFNENFLFAVF